MVGHEHGSSESHNTVAINQIVLTVENKKATFCTVIRAFVMRTRFLRSTPEKGDLVAQKSWFGRVKSWVVANYDRPATPSVTAY